MSLRTRRTVFQLTPLLDLLLIVIFAQYMDVRQAGARQEAWFEKEAGQVQAQAIAKAEQEANLRQQSDIKLALAEEQLKTLQQEHGASEKLVEDLKLQRELMADLLTQSLKIDPSKIEKLIEQGRKNPSFDPKFQETIEKLNQLSQSDAIVHAASYHELLKRCDIWNFRLDLSREKSLENKPNKKSTLLIDIRTLEESQTFDTFLSFDLQERDKERFTELRNKALNEMKNYLKSLPQPKGIVIVISEPMLEDIYFGIRTEFKQLVQELLNDLTLESSGQTRYYYFALPYVGEFSKKSSAKE